MITFRLNRAEGSRWQEKFPRAAFKRLGEHRKTLKVLNYYKGNWDDDKFMLLRGNIYRFIIANIGRPIDKVYSEFLQRCKGNVYGQQKEFNYVLDSHFYLSNGIINKKKRK